MRWVDFMGLSPRGSPSVVGKEGEEVEYALDLGVWVSVLPSNMQSNKLADLEVWAKFTCKIQACFDCTKCPCFYDACDDIN